MCGIFGVVNSSNRKDDDLTRYMSDALIAGTLRGRDGTGMFQVESPYNTASSNDPWDVKILMEKFGLDGATVSNFLGAEKEEKSSISYMVQNAKDSFLTIGHHRAATVGSVSDENAHPFMVTREDGSRIVAVHNGTLDLTVAEKAQYAVDSQLLLAKLAADSGGNTPYLSALGTTFGAVATVFYDSQHPNNFYMYTNGQRPLHFAFQASNTDTMFIASEAEMLYWIANRHRVKLRNDEVLSLRSRHLYKFDFHGKLVDYSSTDVPYSTRTTTSYYRGLARTDYDDAEWYNEGVEHWPSNYSLPGLLRSAVASVIGEAEDDVMPDDELPGQDDDDVDDEPTTQVAGPKSTRPPACSPEEQKKLREALHINPGTDAEFEYEVYVPNSDDMTIGTVYGTTYLEDREGVADIFSGIIRNVPHSKVQEMMGKIAVCKAVGANVDLNKEKSSMSFNILLTHPRYYTAFTRDRAVN